MQSYRLPPAAPDEYCNHPQFDFFLLKRTQLPLSGKLQNIENNKENKDNGPEYFFHCSQLPGIQSLQSSNH